MSFVKVSRAADIVYNYDENGVARVPILEGECKDCALERVAIQPGCSWTPDVYKLEEHNQVFLFMDGEGYVRTPRKVFNIVRINVMPLRNVIRIRWSRNRANRASSRLPNSLP
jgi:hypothetical protein